MKTNLSDYVYYDNTDCGGIMYHANYITICERARSFVFFQNNTFPCADESPTHDGFVMKTMESNFLAPLKLGDYYEVRTKIDSIKNTSLVILHEIYRLRQIGITGDEPLLVFKMKAVMVYIDIKKKPKRIPDSLRSIFMFFQSG
ncbi:acyl-CoA thioesterase [Helicobacter muridarum]|uniref:4-hydroxybenzoyl-CoA thioesterase n=1 Tax=Helicobacter muridarum TaxID=216 RepID=A0A377PVG9_9HELI|nr:thioesterase family protein [Helicobacter muridarum]TLE00596.1 acyl-CoA thioesterase [Helicobacter muridarum]STQ85613.1 4-hydroxybenzoyl-CoA thioesterase [Helicobacter muridarum]